MKKTKTDLKSVPAPAADETKLTAKQQKELAAIETKGVTLKIAIADITEQIGLAENRRRQMFEELYKINGEYQQRVAKFAAALGIDVDADPKVTGERFEFVPQTATFVRIPVEKTPAQ
jgi:hypothetical protein